MASATTYIFRIRPSAICTGDPSAAASALDDFTTEILKGIPGVWVKLQGGLTTGIIMVGAPLNASWLVQKWLQRLNVPFAVAGPAKPPAVIAPSVLAVGQAASVGASCTAPVGLRPWVLSGGEEDSSARVAGRRWPGLAPYQSEAIYKVGHLPGCLLTHPAGSGKTVTAMIMSMLTTPLGKAILVVTKAAAREQWAREIRRFTTEDVLVLMGGAAVGNVDGVAVGGAEFRSANDGIATANVYPSSTQFWVQDYLPRSSMIRLKTAAAIARKTRKSPKTIEDTSVVLTSIDKKGLHWAPVVSAKKFRILEETKPIPAWAFYTGNPIVTALPRFIVTAWETLTTFAPLLLELKLHTIIWDEVQMGKGHKRWTAVPTASGALEFVSKNNIVAWAAELAKHARKRIGTTATPIPDRVRDLWGELDLVTPREWGGFYNWANRYADAHTGAFGGIDTAGKSNEDELKARMSFITHHVPHSVTHADLPPRRRVVTYLSIDQQCEPSAGFAAEMKEALGKGAGAQLEVRLAEAASRKRTYIVETALEAAHSGQKVIIFTTRHRDCEHIHSDLSKLSAKLPTPIPVWLGHGGHSIKDRQAMLDEYMAERNGCILVGGGKAWGTALNMHDTDRLIIAQTPYTWAEIIQQEGRAERKGMSRSLLIEYVIAEGTYDDHVVELVVGKLSPVVDIAGADNLEGMDQELRMGTGEGEAEKVAQSLLAKIFATDADAETAGN